MCTEVCKYVGGVLVVCKCVNVCWWCVSMWVVCKYVGDV